MTTDPRIAALAEALDGVLPRMAFRQYGQFYNDDPDFDIEAYYQRAAAAILAAMPPSFFRDPDDAMTLDLMEAAIRKDQAEIARLRKIEEAARAVDWESVRDALDVAIHAHAEMEVNKERWRADENSTDALRAALEAER